MHWITFFSFKITWGNEIGGFEKAKITCSTILPVVEFANFHRNITQLCRQEQQHFSGIYC